MANENIVDFQAMQNAATAIEQTSQHLGLIDKSMLQAIGVLEVHWTGEASTQFNNVMNDWRGSFNDIITQLGNLHFALVGNRNLNMTNEQNNTPMINKIQGALYGR